MKANFFISTFIWLVLNTSYGQINQSIPTPPDLQGQENGITILDKQRLGDGTIVIRYVNKQGHTIQRRTHPSKPGEKQEWDEANPPQSPYDPKVGVGKTAEGPNGVPGGAPLGGLPGGVLPGGVLPGGVPGGIPPDEPKPAKPTSALDDAKKGAEGILPDNSTPGKPAPALPGGVTPGSTPSDGVYPGGTPLGGVPRGALPGGVTPGNPPSEGVFPGGAPLGGVPGGVLPGGVLPGGVYPGGAPLGGVPGGVLPGGTPLDSFHRPKPTSVLDDVKKGAEGILPDNSTPGKPASGLSEAGKAAKKIAEDILDAISNLLVVNTAGTGQTIGVIANITLKNNNDFPVGILPQTFYIPSDGQHQNYVGHIPGGITIPPDGTVVVPVNGVCADIHTPPVPPEESMPPVSTWVPVGGFPPGVLVESGPPGEPDQSSPPGISDPPSTVAKPVDPPGVSHPPSTVPRPVDPPGVGDPPSTVQKPVDPPVVSDPPSTVLRPVDPPVVGDPPSTVPKPVDPPVVSDPPSTKPTPMNPPGKSTTPKGIPIIPIVKTIPVPDFTPTDIPHITTTSGYKPLDKSNPDIIINWPGTNTPVGGTLVPGSNPEIFAPVIVGVLDAIEKAVKVVQEGESFPTPISRDSVREGEALIQQTFWIVNSILTGNEYTKEDFTGNTYEQFQNNTGKPVSSLPPEQKEQVDSGITDFWNAFHATGIVAKVINAESPGTEVKGK